jgi:taurine dioxygenase
MQVKRLGQYVGAEIEGVDLRRRFDDDTLRRLVDAWHEHLVLLFRNQQINEAEQIAFAQQFGPIALRARAKELRADAGKNEFPDITMLVTNIRENGKLIGSLPDGEVQFHTDQCFEKAPPAGTALYAIEVPSVGGDTVFANMYEVYDSLSAEMKAFIDDKKGLTIYAYGGAKRDLSAIDRNAPDKAVHPLVRTHPYTGRNLLYANRLNTVCIEGLEQAESDEILEALLAAIEQPKFHYAHKWRPGDLLLWDNHAAQHARTDFSAAERRLLRRGVIRGEEDIPTNRLRRFATAS